MAYGVTPPDHGSVDPNVIHRGSADGLGPGELGHNIEQHDMVFDAEQAWKPMRVGAQGRQLYSSTLWSLLSDGRSLPTKSNR
jgi:hypothetical protein